MKTRVSLCFGTVESYNPTSKTGAINIVDWSRSVGFSVANLRNIVPGFSEPVFAPLGPTEVTVNVGDPVVLTLQESHESTSTSTMRILRQKLEVTEWAFATSYNDAWRIIRGRPTFEVVEFTLYNSVPTSTNQRRVIARGTAIELQNNYPWQAANDPLASEKHSLGYTYRRRFYRLGSAFPLQVPDPRIPTAKRQKFVPTNEQGELLATPTEVAFGLGQRTRPLANAS